MGGICQISKIEEGNIIIMEHGWSGGVNIKGKEVGYWKGDRQNCSMGNMGAECGGRRVIIISMVEKYL